MKRIVLYLIFSFGIAWAAWIGTGLATGFALGGTLATAVVSVSMWVPALAVGLAKLCTRQEGRILSFGLHPRLRGHIRWYLGALLLPALFVALGGALYFLVFPRFFSPSGALLQMQIAAQASGMSTQALLVIQVLSAVILAPFINMLFALGEEIGWRGYLFPALAARMKPVYAHLLMGVIWGIWHTPINMMGHNYGLGYPGYPWLGILSMCLFCFGGGVFLSWLTARVGSVWPAALGHGAINAAAGLPFLLLGAGQGYVQALGPGMSGLIGALPLVVFAVILLLRQRKTPLPLCAPPRAKGPKPWEQAQPWQQAPPA